MKTLKKIKLGKACINSSHPPRKPYPKGKSRKIIVNSKPQHCVFFPPVASSHKRSHLLFLCLLHKNVSFFTVESQLGDTYWHYVPGCISGTFVSLPQRNITKILNIQKYKAFFNYIYASLSLSLSQR